MRCHTLPLSCILNPCSLFDGNQLQEIVSLLLYTPVSAVPLFFSESSVLFCFFCTWQWHKARGQARFALSSTKIDRWAITVTHVEQMHEISCPCSVRSPTFWKSNYCSWFAVEYIFSELEETRIISLHASACFSAALCLFMLYACLL